MDIFSCLRKSYQTFDRETKQNIIKMGRKKKKKKLRRINIHQLFSAVMNQDRKIAIIYFC